MAVRVLAASQKPKCRKKECIRPPDSKRQGDSHNPLVHTERVISLGVEDNNNNNLGWLGGVKEGRRR